MSDEEMTIVRHSSDKGDTDDEADHTQTARTTD